MAIVMTLLVLFAVVVVSIIPFLALYVSGIRRVGVLCYDGFMQTGLRKMDDGRPLNGSLDIFSSQFHPLLSIHLDETRPAEVRISVVKAPKSEVEWLGEFASRCLEETGDSGQYVFRGRLAELGRVLEAENKTLSDQGRRLRVKIPRLARPLA